MIVIYDDDNLVGWAKEIPLEDIKQEHILYMDGIATRVVEYANIVLFKRGNKVKILKCRDNTYPQGAVIYFYTSL